MKIHKQIKSRIQNHNLYKRAIENRILAVSLLIIIILITYSYFSEGFIYDIAKQDLNETIEFINSFGRLSWLIYIFTMIAEVVIAPISSIILNIAGSILFGSFKAAMLTIIGSIIGNIIAYFLARHYGNLYFEKLITEKRKAVFEKYSSKYGPLFLFILRLNPITSSDLFTYFAGLIGMPFRYFLISTMLGVIPMIFIISYFGEAFIKDNPFFKLLFIIITTIYIIIFLYLILIFTKNKIKARFLKK